MKALSIILCGASGRMGQAIRAALVMNPKSRLLGATISPHSKVSVPKLPDFPDVLLATSLAGLLAQVNKRAHPTVIDVSAIAATEANLAACVERGLPLVLGVTGLSKSQQALLEKAARKIPILQASNFSLGVAAMSRVVEKLAAELPKDFDLEIVEKHHRLKKDAPSGTALHLANALARGRGLPAPKSFRMSREGAVGIRNPKEIGIQSIRGGDIVGDHSVIFAGPGERIEILHQAHSRETFALGALAAARFLGKQKKKRLYTMFDVLEDAD